MSVNNTLIVGVAAIAMVACSAKRSEESAVTHGESVQSQLGAGEEKAGTDIGAADAVDEADKDLCGAGDYQSIIGANLAAVTFPADLDHRIIAPDTVVTMDYIPTRLNIHMDEDGVITEIKCG